MTGKMDRKRLRKVTLTHVHDMRLTVADIFQSPRLGEAT